MGCQSISITPLQFSFFSATRMYQIPIIKPFTPRVNPWKAVEQCFRAGSHFDISVSISINISIRKTCVNRDYISICISICISTRNGTFSIFLCLCLCFCCEYFSVNRAVHKHKHKHKSFLVSGIHKNTIQARSTNTKTKTWLRR